MSMPLRLWKKSTILCILASLTAGLFHQNAMAAPATRPDAKCEAPSQDPFVPGLAIGETSPRFAGVCLDEEVFRPVQILEHAGRLRFANLLHENLYWTATLPSDPALFDKTFFQVQRFPVVKGIEAAHVQLRIRLKPGAFIELESQTEPGRKSRINSFVASFEAARPKGVEYNFALGAFDNYVLVGRIASAEQRQFERRNTRTEQYVLDLRPEEIRDLAVRAVRRSAERGANFYYNTLKPNCTTEILDMIDELPRFKGQHRPFLTLISADPIVRPSLDALAERHLLSGRVQDMNDERLDGGGMDQPQVMPPRESAEIPFLPRVKGRPWTLVVTLPPLEKMRADERAAIVELRSQLLQKAPLLLQGLGSALMLGDLKDENAALLLSGMIQKLQAEVAEVLVGLNGKLSPELRTVGLYIVPFKSAGAPVVRLEDLGVPAALPFAVVDAVTDIDDGKSQEIYFHIAEGARSAADAGQKQPTQFFLQAAALKIQLQKDRSSSTAQLMMGLRALKKDFTMKNAQVAFKEVRIEEPTARAFRPVLLLSQRQEAAAAPHEIVEMRFGAEGGIAGRMNADHYGQFQMLGTSQCQVQAEAVPTLVGVFAEAPLDNGLANLLLKGKPVSFGIFGVDVNLRSQKIQDMRIKVATWPVSCLDVEKVNSQFRDEANSMLTKYKGEADLDALVKKLMGQLIR